VPPNLAVLFIVYDMHSLYAVDLVLHIEEVSGLRWGMAKVLEEVANQEEVVVDLPEGYGFWGLLWVWV
jgi:hypothetical protein